MISERRINNARKFLSKISSTNLVFKHLEKDKSILSLLLKLEVGFIISSYLRKTTVCRKLLSRNATNQLIENIIHEMYEVNFERYQNLLLYRWKKSQKK